MTQKPQKNVSSTPAQRALDEAKERHHLTRSTAPRPPKELGGRDGPDPVRFGDWEKNGIISDF